MPPRSRSQRPADVLAKLRDDVDLWVASADESGEAYLVPLSFHWEGAELPRGTDPQLEAAFAAAAGFEPPEGYVYLRITPREIQAWREADELAGRRLMRDGAWL